MRDRILEILNDINPYVEINEASKLLEEGILDSLGVMVLIGELEKAYGIEIKMDNLQMEWFEDVSSIEQMIKELKR